MSMMSFNLAQNAVVDGAARGIGGTEPAAFEQRGRSCARSQRPVCEGSNGRPPSRPAHSGAKVGFVEGTEDVASFQSTGGSLRYSGRQPLLPDPPSPRLGSHGQPRGASGRKPFLPDPVGDAAFSSGFVADEKVCNFLPFCERIVLWGTSRLVKMFVFPFSICEKLIALEIHHRCRSDTL